MYKHENSPLSQLWRWVADVAQFSLAFVQQTFTQLQLNSGRRHGTFTFTHRWTVL